MAIPAVREAAAINAFIKTKGNKTLTYQAAHPNAQYNTANQNAPAFIVKYDIEKKAIAVLNKDDKLNVETLTKSLSNEVSATKSLYYKGREYVQPDYPTRLNAKRTILLDIYGIGRRDNINYNDNREVNVDVDIDKLAVVVDDLKSITDKIRIEKEKFIRDRDE